MKISDKKSESNRANAEQSTGPRSESGKIVVALNGVVHGLRSAKPVLPSLGETDEDWERHRDLMVADIAPEGTLETGLAERIALGFWRLARGNTIEQKSLTATIETFRWNGIRSVLLEEGRKKYNESTEAAIERLIGHRDQQRMIADLWELVEHGADDLPVDPCLADDLLYASLPSHMWKDCADAFEEKFQSLPEDLGNLRSMLKWLANQTSLNTEEFIRSRSLLALERAENADQTVSRIEQRGELAAYVGLLESDVLSKLSRYETAIHRAIQRDLHELQRLQARRQGEPVLAPISIDVNSDC